MLISSTQLNAFRLPNLRAFDVVLIGGIFAFNRFVGSQFKLLNGLRMTIANVWRNNLVVVYKLAGR